MAPVQPDVLAVHKSDVGCPEQPLAVLVTARAGAPLAQADEAVEVGDRRRVAATALDCVGRADRIVGGREIEVEEAEPVNLRPARNRARDAPTGSFRPRNRRYPEGGSDGHAG